MSQTRTVKPVEGRRIRDPADKRNRPLPDEGKAVVWTSYWQRALDAGDITVVEPTESPAPAATPSKGPAGSGAPPEPPRTTAEDKP